MSETDDKTKAAANKVAGSIKESVGEATEDKDLQNEGAAQKLKGRGQEFNGEAKGALEDND